MLWCCRLWRYSGIAVVLCIVVVVVVKGDGRDNLNLSN
jgi:hypothetical protein